MCLRASAGVDTEHDSARQHSVQQAVQLRHVRASSHKLPAEAGFQNAAERRLN